MYNNREIKRVLNYIFLSIGQEILAAVQHLEDPVNH
jgi:hypothetical protein